MQKASTQLINIAALMGCIGTLINIKFLYIAFKGMLYQLVQILLQIPVDETVLYDTQPMLIGIYILAFAMILAIVSIFATIFEGLNEDLKNPSNIRLQKTTQTINVN
jgi:hypothetical protein